MVVPWINCVNICHLPVNNNGSILVVQHCHMVPSHKMHLNRLLTALQHSMEDVNSDHIMVIPLHNSRTFCFCNFHLYSSYGKFDIYLSTLELIIPNSFVKNATLILHGDWYINFLHKSNNINGNSTFIMRKGLKNTVNVPTRLKKIYINTVE
jgi:hypothetical protein